MMAAGCVQSSTNARLLITFTKWCLLTQLACLMPSHSSISGSNSSTGIGAVGQPSALAGWGTINAWAPDGAIMRCRRAAAPGDATRVPWVENIPIETNTFLTQIPCLCNKQGEHPADRQVTAEYEFQIQAVTGSQQGSAWSKSIFHEVKGQDCPATNNVDDGLIADKYANQDVRLTKLMVVGGLDGNYDDAVRHVEVIDLASNESVITCPVPPDLRDGPLNVGAVGAFIAGNGIDKAVVCAAENAGNKCYTYSNMTDTWDEMPGSLIHSLYGRAAVVLGDGRWWLTGGCCPNSDQTEILEFNAGRDAIRSQAFEPLPRPTWNHHMLLLNESAVVFFGGRDTKTDELWLFNIHTREWTQLQSMPRARKDPVAGLARYGNDGNQNKQRQLVVTGGWDEEDTSTFIFDFDSNKWRNGSNNFPHRIYWAASVQYEDTFLLVGGRDSSGERHLDTIYEFDATNEKWVQTSKKLLRGRKSDPAAFLIPDSYVHGCAG